MEPDYLYTALLDVLAYRNYLEEDRRTGELRFHDRLNSALSVFQSVNEPVFNIQSISDTIILTCSTHNHFPEFLRLIRDVFLAFMSQNLFVRGGLAYSRHFQSGHLTYSHAIARAYELESRIAQYPRIVVDNNIIEMYEVGNALPSLRSKGLLCKEQGTYFIDVTSDGNWHRVYENAKRIYTMNADSLALDERALDKHIRFERYLLMSPNSPNDSVPFISGITPY